jgi:hypothetical protein
MMLTILKGHCCNSLSATLPSLDHVPSFIFYYQPKHIFVLNKMLFTPALATTPHLFLSGLSRMVYEYLLNCFIPKDPSLGFLELFHVVVAITCGDILRSMALMLRLTNCWKWQKTFEVFILLP